MSEKLKPCPFCGEAARMLPPTCLPETPYNPADRLYPIVSCFGCDADVAGKTEDYKGDTAVAAWNERVSPEASLREAASTLVKAIDACEPHMISACAVSALHGAPYVGPTYEKELAALRALTATTDKGD